LLAAGGGYFVLRYFADHAGLFATINLGQHRLVSQLRAMVD
jgi:hypothetical protein